MVGDKYKLKVPCLGCLPGTVGIVFYNYITGEQLIFPNGNYDGFSNEEKERFLVKVGHSEKTENYKFKNVSQVSVDFDKGYWNGEFAQDPHLIHPI